MCKLNIIQVSRVYKLNEWIIPGCPLNILDIFVYKGGTLLDDTVLHEEEEVEYLPLLYRGRTSYEGDESRVGW